MYRADSVTYSWDCAGATDHCYPASVSYNGALLEFHREARPDPVSSPANVVMRERLESIDVALSGSRVRAYQLSYASSAQSARSLLSSVQMYGTDAVLDGSGTITGGTSLPANGFTYRDDGQQNAFTGATWSTESCEGTGTMRGTGDFDGDGRMDLYCHFGSGNGLDTEVRYSNGTSFSTGQVVLTSWCNAVTDVFTTGDFDGDGFTDFACHFKGAPRTEVSLNNGDGTFSTPAQWNVAGWCGQSDALWGVADANGDGKTDEWCHTGVNDGMQAYVGVSDGTSFTSGLWASNWCWTADAFYTVGPDVNGDGRADAMCRGASSGLTDFMVSTGTSFIASSFPTLSLGCNNVSTFGMADFNADGKTDLWCRVPAAGQDPGGIRAALSTGHSWVGVDGSSNFVAMPGYCNSSTSPVASGDFNGDGRTDLLCRTGTGNAIALARDVAGFVNDGYWLVGGCGLARTSGDFNGDGKTDLRCYQSGTTTVEISGTVTGRPDVLTSFDGSLGGRVDIAYTPSSSWTNTNGPPVRETVVSLTRSDGRGWQSTRSYEYADGKFDWEKRRDLGFGYSKVTLPKLATEGQSPYTETWFSQTVASAGAVVKSERRDGAGNLFTSMENTIVVDGDGETEPYRARVTERWSYVFDGTVTGCGSWPCTNGERRYQEFDYDSWGNKVETRSWGNYDVAGDETTSSAEFYPNASTYVTNKTARSASYVGIGTTGTKLGEVQFLYDGESQYTSSPTDGLLTKTAVWRDTDDALVPQCNLASCVQYDAYGNITQTTDVKGGQTSVVYDTTYHLFPTSTTNALNQTTTSDWNEVCEAVSSTTNPNSQTTTATYDVFCRHERTDGPLGSFAESVYQNFGNPGTQYVEMQGPSPDGTGVAWARSYFDGLGRAYERESRGPSGGQNILSGEVTFNERGGVLTSTATRYANETAEVTSYQYDSLDRRTLTTLPDLNTVSQSYGLRESYVTNPEGDVTGQARDETGLVIYTIEYLGGTPIVTSITTDLANRTQTTQDHQGNVWVSQLNSLGQVISLSDPDSGTETREYDDAGEMTATVNALSERTELSYDLLGRPTREEDPDGGT